MLDPSLFDDPLPFLEKLSKNPSSNILLFELSIFLRTLSKFGVASYYLRTLVSYSPLPILPQVKSCIIEDNLYRGTLIENHLQPNCDMYPSFSCPDPCVKCGSKCSLSASVKNAGTDECQPMNPKEIALEMIKIYFLILKITGHEEKKSFRLSKFKKLIDEELPKFPTTLDDYVKFGLMTPKRLNQALEVAPTPAAMKYFIYKPEAPAAPAPAAIPSPVSSPKELLPFMSSSVAEPSLALFPLSEPKKRKLEDVEEQRFKRMRL
jgi:hypothetical protein